MNFKRLLASALGCLAVAFVLQLGSPAKAHAEDPGLYSLSSVQRVAVSSITTSPTTLLSSDVQTKQIWLINNNTDYLMLGDADTTFSSSATTGTFRLYGTLINGTTVQPTPFAIGPFKGTLKAVAGGSGNLNIDVLKAK